MQRRHIRHGDLEQVAGKVTQDGGDLRQLHGGDVGLSTSVMHSQIVPGSGPRRHRHPHAEILVLHDGKARFELEGAVIDAEAGDVVIVPPDAWHAFVNSGTGMLRLTAIHENARATTEFEDGTVRE